jgi:hypothetical protein
LCLGAEDSSPLTWSLKVLLNILTGSKRGRYHSGPLKSVGVVHWKNRLLKMLDHNPHCCWLGLHLYHMTQSFSVVFVGDFGTLCTVRYWRHRRW